jgi:hypothetical protein
LELDLVEKLPSIGQRVQRVGPGPRLDSKLERGLIQKSTTFVARFNL